MTFIKKTLKGTETPGGYLKELLVDANTKLEHVARLLHIQEKHLESLLADDYSKLADVYYARHLARRLATLLGGRPEYVDKLFGKVASRGSENPEQVFEYKKVSRASLFVTARAVTGGTLGLVFASFLVYLGLNAHRALTPPQIELRSPGADIVTKERLVVVEGQTEREAKIVVNGEQVASDDEGNFKAPLFLEEGLNVIEVRVAKRYSREQVVYRKVLVEPAAKDLSRK